MNKIHCTRPAFAAAMGFALAAPAGASHHFETALSNAYPAYDLTDLFVFEAATPGKTVFIVAVNPQTKNDGTASFGESGLYNIHISADHALTSGLTLTFRPSNGNIVVGRHDGPNPALGVEGTQLGMAPVGKATKLPNGLRLWAGGARDPFVGNADGLGQFQAALTAGRYDAKAFDNASNLFQSLFTSALVIEVPNDLLPREFNVFASSAMLMDGRWMQVNRLAHVLTTHLFLMADPTLSAEHVMHRPDEDPQRKQWIAAMIARASGLAKSQADPLAYGDRMAERLIPDMLPYRVGTKARYAVDSFNGRATTDDAMDAVLSIFVGQTMTDNANTFDHHPREFPYLVPTVATKAPAR